MKERKPTDTAVVTAVDAPAKEAQPEATQEPTPSPAPTGDVTALKTKVARL